MAFHDVGRMTLTLFNKLYAHYKDDFDLETILRASNTTYAELYEKTQKQQEWF